MKELQRHVANRGGLALGGLLIASAILLSLFNPAGLGAGGTSATEASGTGMVGGVHHCMVVFPKEDSDLMTPLLDYLQLHTPADLKQQLQFRELSPDRIYGAVRASPGVGCIVVRSVRDRGRRTLHVQLWHPPGDPGALAPYEAWLWRELRAGLQHIAEKRLRAVGVTTPLAPPLAEDDLWAVRESLERLQRSVEAARPTASDIFVPEVTIERQGLGGKVLELRSAIATGLVVFALYFACVYLLPTLNCEERERGVLLAQALSPASPVEILAAKFLFYPTMGGGLGAIIAGIYKPAVLSTLFFWLALLAVAAAFLGIGMTIATLAKTQRAAFMGAMCYLMSVSMVLIICSTNGIPFLPYLAIEYHVPRVLHATLSGNVQSNHWLHLAASFMLASGWITTAAVLFRRRGWQ